MASPPGIHKPCLGGLAPELVEKIAADLDLNALRNSRLTSRMLEDRCSGPRFKSFLSRQKTDLTPTSLSRLISIARHQKFGPAVNTVLVLAVVYDYSELDRMLSTKRRRVFEQQGVFSMTTEPQATQEELDEAQQTREKLMSQEREQQELNCDDFAAHRLRIPLKSFRTLKTLAVEGAVAQGTGGYAAPSSIREWHPVWIRASEVYDTVMLAIALSGIALETLVVYNQSRRCSVPTFDVNETVDLVNLGEAGRNIKNFSLSVSTKVETDEREVARSRDRLSEAEQAYYDAGMGTKVGLFTENDPDAVAEGNYPGVARLLRQTPNLESLDLHLYNTLSDGAKSYAKVFTYIADDVVLPSLRQCTLRGLRVTEESLIKFLHVHSGITMLELCEMHLVSGTWAPIFAQLCSMPYLQQVRLHNIWGPKRLLSLAPKDKPWKEDFQSSPSDGWTDNRNCSYPCLDGIRVHTRSFDREEILSERFEFARGPAQRQLGSAQFMAWMRTTEAEYGPP